jgi:transposase-like protein
VDYDVEIRPMCWSKIVIESLNARCRQALQVRSHFLTEEAGR